MSAVPRFGAIVLDCPDPAVLARFYADLLDWQVVEEESDREWVTVRGPGGPQLDFQLAPNHVAPQWPDGQPQQAHLDLYVEDVATAHRRVLDLGGTALDPAEEPRPAPERGFRVYADPAGHPFCLCRPTPDAWG